MSDSDGEIYENDVELPRYLDTPQQTSLRIKRTKTEETGKPSVNSRAPVPLPGRSDRSKMKNNFAVFVVIALLILIALACVTLTIVVMDANDDKDATSDDGTGKGDRPLATAAQMRKNCKDIKDNNADAKSGLYLVRIEGTERILLVYCDHDTAGGGWTLVYSYEFTKYHSFTDKSNAVTPVPNWGIAPNQVKASTKTPRNEEERGAMDFSYWKAMGAEFLVKSNINNWMKCSPSGGNLVELVTGDVSCSFVNIFHNCSSGNRIPVKLEMNTDGPVLVTNDTAAGYVTYFWEGNTDRHFPVHDPCGLNSANQRTLVQEPYGAIFLR